MKDDAVLEIAAHAPKTIEQLARTRSLGRGVAEGKLGQDILDAVAAGLKDPNPPPAIPGKAKPPPGIGPPIELPRVLLKQRVEDSQVAQKLIASSDDLEAIAADDNAPVPAHRAGEAARAGVDRNSGSNCHSLRASHPAL
jgi:ribonuclease D